MKSCLMFCRRRCAICYARYISRRAMPRHANMKHNTPRCLRTLFDGFIIVVFRPRHIIVTLITRITDDLRLIIVTRCRHADTIRDEPYHDNIREHAIRFHAAAFRDDAASRRIFATVRLIVFATPRCWSYYTISTRASYVPMRVYTRRCALRELLALARRQQRYFVTRCALARLLRDYITRGCAVICYYSARYERVALKMRAMIR